MMYVLKKIVPLFLLVFISVLLPNKILAADNYVESRIPEEVMSAREQEVLNQAGMGYRQSNVQYTKFVEDSLGPVPGITAVANNPEYNKRLAQKSAIGGISRLITMMYENPPASTYAFVKDMGQSLGFIPKQTYAQGTGIGFSGLSPLLPIWKAFRNVAYLLLAVIMIVVGFMVMLRKKIDPKTVVTVQNALPKIIIALLLVTFSYAIVGFVIDLMYLVMMIFLSVLVTASGGSLDSSIIGTFTSGGFWTLVGQYIFGNNLGTAGERWFNLFSLFGILGYFPVTQLLIGVLVSLGLLFGFIRVLVMLISAYIQIIISLLTAPFQLLMEAVPGSNSFSSWLKNLISNIVVFPITAIMILLSDILTNKISGGETLWTPPLLSANGSNPRGIIGLISLGILLTIPSVVHSIKEALKAKAPVGAGPGAIFAPITGTFQTAMGTASQFYYGGQILKPLIDKFKNR